MDNNIDIHILQMNFIEFLTSFLEGSVPLATVLKVNEKIYSRDPATLSPALITATTELHDLKERINRREKIDEDTIIYIVDDIVLKLIDTKRIKIKD